MFTDSFILVNLFFHLILTFFVIEMVVIGCDLDDLNMFLNVLKHISGMLSHDIVLLERNQQEYQYLFKLIHILTTNKIKYVLHDGIKFWYYKKPIFLELMLES